MHGNNLGEAPPGRRAVIVEGGAALVITALGVVASGCGNGSTSATDVPPTAAGQVPGAGSAGTPLGPAAEIPVGGGNVYEALEVVVTQPVTGDFQGFSAVCTHTGCIVNRIADALIECPCHGSRYKLDGTVAAGPAPR